MRDDSGMKFGVLALGILTGIYALALIWFGEGVVEAAFLRRWPLLAIAGVASLIAAAVAMLAPAAAGLLLVTSAACWFGLTFMLAPGGGATSAIPLAATVLGAALAFRAAGGAQVLATSDRMSIWVGKAFAFAVVILTVVVCYEVFMRYVLRAPTRWAYDAGYMLYGAGFFMAGAYALCQNAHVRADVIYRFWRPRTQASIDLILFLLFFFPAAFFFIYQGYIFAERSWMMREFSSASPFNIPVYHFKTLIPISGMLLFLQGIAEVIRAGLCLRDGQWPPRQSDVEEIEKAAMEGHLPLSVAGIGAVDLEREGQSDASRSSGPVDGDPRQ